MNWRRLMNCTLALAIGITCSAAAHSWRDKVSEGDRARINPYANQSDAARGGAKLYAEHCGKCHGSDALGAHGKPSLRTRDVQQATDGELFWMLKNGNRYRGMPSWNALPEPARWQIITFIKSLGEAGDKGAAGLRETR